MSKLDSIKVAVPVLVFTVGLTACALVLTGHSANATVINSVSFTGSDIDPTVTIYGSGFGSEPAGTAVSTLGYSPPDHFTGSDYGNSLWIYDATGFRAGRNYSAEFDWIGLLVSSYTPTEIVFTFGSGYPSYGEFVQGNAFTASVDGVTYSGDVNYTPIPAALPLFATGLGGLGLFGWRRKRKAKAVT
jgi:hypothetical protein